MSASTSLAASEQIIFIGVHEELRHSIPRTEPMHEYRDGGIWAFARCRRAAWEPPVHGALNVERMPMCDECASLEAEERASEGSQ